MIAVHQDPTKRKTILFGILTFAILILIMTEPEHTFQASSFAIQLWGGIIFPAMLPALVISKVFVKLTGELLFIHYKPDHATLVFNRKMRWITLGWLCLLGTSSFTPVLLRTCKEKRIFSPQQCEYWAILSQLFNPLLIWIILVVGVGYLHSQLAGLWLTSIYVISVLCSAFIFRLFIRNDVSMNRKNRTGIEVPYHLHKDLSQQYKAHFADQETFGQLLSKSISTSIQSLLLLGGNLVMFSVVVVILANHQIVPNLMFSGIFEVNLGVYQMSQSSILTWQNKLTWIATSIAWGGLLEIVRLKSEFSIIQMRYFYLISFKVIQTIMAFGCAIYISQLWSLHETYSQNMTTWVSPKIKDIVAKDLYSIDLQTNLLFIGIFVTFYGVVYMCTKKMVISNKQ